MKFRDKQTGDILEPAIDWVAGSYKAQPERYEELKEKPEKAKPKAKKK